MGEGTGRKYHLMANQCEYPVISIEPGHGPYGEN